MKNNRPIEVGQVRMLKKFGDGTGWESSMYVVSNLQDDSAKVIYITGEWKGRNGTWSLHLIEEDIVVM